MDTYVLLGIVLHVVLAVGVGAHAEIRGRSRLRWVPLVLLVGVVGVVWYVANAPADGDVAAGAADDGTERGGSARGWSGTATVDHPDEIPDERPEWLDRRSRAKRLADPSTLHIDLPDGTTLTSDEQAAVGAAIEYLDEDPDATADDVCEHVFEDADAGYQHPGVWWTETVCPALRGLPDVEPPPGSTERELAFTVDPVEELEDRRGVAGDDGQRREDFFVQDGEVWAADGDAVARTSPGWMRLAHGAVTDAVGNGDLVRPDEEGTASERAGTDPEPDGHSETDPRAETDARTETDVRAETNTHSETDARPETDGPV